MGHIFRCKQSIPFTQTYYDSTGGLVSPSSVRVWVTYATTNSVVGKFPYEGTRDTTNFTLTQNTTTLAFEGSWSSTATSPGMCYYHIRASDSTLDTVDGQFELRGNPANAAST